MTIDRAVRTNVGIRSLRWAYLAVLLGALLFSPTSFAQEDDDCLMCHGERDFVADRDGREISLFVNGNAFADSTHGEIGCISCHMDADVEEFPHEDRLSPVNCSICHDDEVSKYNRSLHGQAHQEGRYLAPICTTCHGKHNILSAANERSRTYVMNIPALCGSCHKEGTEVSQLRTVEREPCFRRLLPVHPW